MTKALTYIEIDVPDFADSSPEEIVTYRFTYPTNFLPTDIEAVPSLMSVSHSPATISLGRDLGTRASLSLTFSDHKHVMNGESFDSGTFWGKWRARHGQTLQGRPLRWIQGTEGQSLAQMETRHFIIESTDGPTQSGVYTITAKDILKLADSERAQAPLPSSGFIVGDLTAVGTAATLSPAGIGNAEYPASGYIALGGEEIVGFTRTNDTLTLARGQLNTVAVEHDAGARAQLVLYYDGDDPADVIYDLMVNYAGISASYIPLTSWQNETSTYFQQNISAVIAEPTGVNKLINEIIEQCALAVWWEPLTQLIRLQVLRPIASSSETFSHENIIEGTLGIKEQPGIRISQVFAYFGQRNPLEPIDEENNFRSAYYHIDSTAELTYRLPVLKKIYCRWIPFGARTVAARLTTLLLGRYRDPPRRFNFSCYRYGDITPTLGGGFYLEAYPLQTATGAQATAPIQITRLNPLSDRYEVEAEELLFDELDPADLVDRVIIIDASINNVNLRTLHDAIYPDPDASASPAESLTVIIDANVIVGSDSTTAPALDVGSWPVGYPITIEVHGRIQGKGGRGGDGSRSDPNTEATNGQAGGTALYSRFPITLNIESTGEIWGGGGGGGGLDMDSEEEDQNGIGGGGGAGQTPGLAGTSYAADGDSTDLPEDGTTEAGGSGGLVIFKTSGDGGDPGEAGGASFSNSGGAAGTAIDGVSFCTITEGSPSNILGPQVN